MFGTAMKADTIIESVKKALGWVGVLLALSGPSALGAAYDFTINMNGSQEVPVNLVPGTGAGVASYDDVSNLLTWSMTWSDLTGPAAGIHFHGPAGVGTNAAVQVNLGAISGLTSPTFGAVVISEVQEAQLLNSLWYVNIHTEAYPDGEIRGQVTLDGPPLFQDVTAFIETLGTGDTVILQFDVVIADPLPVGVIAVTNQASISGSNVVAFLTDDPDTGILGDATVTMLPIDYDFGDASRFTSPSPRDYPTLLADNGARHILPFSGPVIFLGAEVDAEADGLPSVDAQGDDLTRIDDEDGVLLPANLVVGTTVDVEVTASAPGVLNAWVDFDADGEWGPSDQIFIDEGLAGGVNNLSFVVPVEAVNASSYARFRVNSGGRLPPVGLATDGEVEDYRVTLTTAKTTVEIVDNDLVITDIVSRGKDDTLSITRDGSSLVVIDTNNTLTSTTATIVTSNEVRATPSAITGRIEFDLLGGDDETVVDFSNGDLGANVAVDSGLGTDKVVIIGSERGDGFFLSKTVVFGSQSPVSITNQESLAVAGLGGDDRYIAGDGWGVIELVERSGGGSDILDLSAVTVPLDVVVSSLVVSDLDGNVISHAGQEIESIRTGSGADNVFVGVFSNSLSVSTAESTDVFELGESNSLDGITGPLNLDGGPGFDFLTVNDQADADRDSYTMTATSLQRSMASPVTYTNLEFLTLNTTNDGLYGQLGDGSEGALFSAWVNLGGTVDISNDLVIELDGGIQIDSNVVLTGSGAITNRGVISTDGGDVQFTQSVILEGGGTITAASGTVFTVEGDFVHSSGNPAFDLLRGGVILSASNRHDLTANSLDMGASLMGYAAGNRPIGRLKADGAVDVFGTVYIWELSGPGDITVQDRSVLYYVSADDWSGTLTLLGNGAFEQVFVGFDEISAGAGPNTMIEWSALPGLTWNVETSDNVVSGVWVNATGFVGTATSERFTDSDPGSATSRVYRLRVRP